MKQTTKMSRAIGQLEKMFNSINTDFFNGELPTPIITVQSKPGTWGHMSCSRIWKRKDEETYEMNIAAESANGPIEELIDTIIHEGIHLYCRINDIKEVSRGGVYHNKRFKEEAEKRGLVVYRTDKYGYNTIGKDNDKLIEYALSKDWTELQINRQSPMSFGRLPIPGAAAPTGAEHSGSRPSSTRKYICPKCGNSVRATKDVNIICGDCMVKMVKEEK